MKRALHLQTSQKKDLTSLEGVAVSCCAMFPGMAALQHVICGLYDLFVNMNILMLKKMSQ